VTLCAARMPGAGPVMRNAAMQVGDGAGASVVQYAHIRSLIVEMIVSSGLSQL
jgi:hypothetical protein